MTATLTEPVAAPASLPCGCDQDQLCRQAAELYQWAAVASFQEAKQYAAAFAQHRSGLFPGQASLFRFTEGGLRHAAQVLAGTRASEGPTVFPPETWFIQHPEASYQHLTRDGRYAICGQGIRSTAAPYPADRDGPWTCPACWELLYGRKS